MSPTQTALLVTEIGKPVTVKRDQQIPEPGPNQVQLKVTVAGLNPHDEKSRDTGLFISGHLPAILSNDVAGVVTALGPGVTKYAVGDRVFTQGTFTVGSLQNGLQQYAVADEKFSAKIPDSLSDDDAASLPTNIIAPLVAFFHPETLGIPAPWTEQAKTFDYAGITILMIGGGSNCGRFGVQLAKLAGIGKIVVVGGNEDELRRYGATDVIDRHGGQDAVLDRIRKVVGDDLVYAYDAINPVNGQVLAVNALSSHKKGKMARLIPVGSVDETKVIGKTAGWEVKNVFGSSQAKPDVCEPFWDRVTGYLADGKIVPTPYVVAGGVGLDADKVNELLDRYRDGESVKKTHFHVS